jgi:hypothetical protein
MQFVQGEFPVILYFYPARVRSRLLVRKSVSRSLKCCHFGNIADLEFHFYLYLVDNLRNVWILEG